MDINKISGIVVDAAVKIHSAIGPGCFERVYEEVLYFELNKRGLYVERQITMPIEYDILVINDAYRLDLLIEKKIKIEIKSIEHISPVHFKQVMTYLKLMNIKNGIILNFKTNLMKDGIYRSFNNFGTA